MRRTMLLTAVATAIAVAAPVGLAPNLAGLAASTARADTSVNIDVFFPALKPYGQWVRNTDYNYVWVPTNVDRDWTPYTHGHWVYTDQYGWYFESDEPFAWAVYHYGRWGYEPALGWYWVPGTRWAPAWVAWRRGDHHVGWAPLPPEDHGYAVNVNINVNVGAIPQSRWTFVQSDQFLQPNLSSVIVRDDRNFYPQSQPVGAVTVQNNVVVNNVININFIQQETHHKVDVHHVQQVNDPKQAKAEGSGGTISAFIANLAPPPADKKPEGAVDQQQAEKSDLPTRRSQAEANQGGNGPGQPGANAENQQQCVDTDPHKKGCQPGENQPAGNNAQATPGGPGGNGNGPRNAENGQPNGHPAGNANNNGPGGQPQNNPGAQGQAAEQNPANCPQDVDPHKPGCQTGNAADRGPSNAQGPSQAQAPSGKDHGQANDQGAAANGKPLANGPGKPEQQGQAANGNGNPEQNCPKDLDPRKPGCQMPDKNAQQNDHPNGHDQGAALQPGNGPNGKSAGQAADQAPGHNPGAGNQREAACPQDLDPRRPGCQQSPAAGQQGALEQKGAGRNANARGATAGNNQQAADNNPKSKCKVDADPRKPGCQQPTIQ